MSSVPISAAAPFGGPTSTNDDLPVGHQVIDGSLYLGNHARLLRGLGLDGKRLTSPNAKPGPAGNGSMRIGICTAVSAFLVPSILAVTAERDNQAEPCPSCQTGPRPLVFVFLKGPARPSRL